MSKKTKLDKKISDHILEEKYPLGYRGPVRQERYGDWKVISELVDFKIVFTTPSTLLNPANVDVMFIYHSPKIKDENKQKKLVIYGKEDDVFKVAQTIINMKVSSKKGALMERFVKSWEKARIDGYSTLTKNKLNPFNLIQPQSLLANAIDSKGIDRKTFADKIGKGSASVYHHTRGLREISRETAIEYAEKLNCDPVDLMFNKITIPIWAKTNTLKMVRTDDFYDPCRLYSYTVDKAERVIVPRDIFRTDLKAIQIDAKGSMYDGQVGFYYYSKTADTNHSNKLVVVGVEEKGLFDDEETNYYFGLYEEVRGVSNLINPDPYITDENQKYVKKNFEPEFIAPIIAMVNPNQIVDNTKLHSEIPAAEYRKEEKLRAEIEKLKYEIKAKDLVAKQRKNISEQLKEATFQLEKQLSILQEKQEKQKLDIFKREQTVMERLRAFGKHENLKIKTGTND